MLPLSAWFWVAIGGALGAVLRFSLSLLIGVGASGFPWQTLSVNVLGSFAIGYIWGGWWDAQWFAQWGRYLLVVGLLGGFTTFSAFSLEVLALVQNQRFWIAMVLVLSSVVLCLLAVWAGAQLGSMRAE